MQLQQNEMEKVYNRVFWCAVGSLTLIAAVGAYFIGLV